MKVDSAESRGSFGGKVFSAYSMGSPSTFAGGASFKPILKPVGIHSTKATFAAFFTFWTVSFASFDLILPR